jgi:hypothetical protein
VTGGIAGKQAAWSRPTCSGIWNEGCAHYRLWFAADRGRVPSHIR